MFEQPQQQNLGLQFGGGPKYQQMISAAHPSDTNADITHPFEPGGSTATTKPAEPDWDETTFQHNWVDQHEANGQGMAEPGDLSQNVMRYSNQPGLRRPMDNPE